MWMPHTPHRTREDLLRILLDTATDIAALDDVEDVLQAIVRRTRSLLGTDMAYISFTDLDRSETYIRQTDGVTTHGYRTLRQPLGTGVLGQIARGVAPYQTRDYLDDDHLTHLPEIDAIVRAEGVRAIMGVPLTVGGRALGALVVAERRPRSFTPEEISDVDSLGRHAAVALDKSMRFAELARTADDLAREKDQRAAQLEMISEMVSLDNELIGTMTEAPSISRILAVGQRALARDLEVRDDDGVLAGTAESPLGSAETVPVTAGDEVLGVLSAEGEIDDATRALLERIAAHVALAMLFLRAQDDADLRLQTEVLGDLLARPDAPRDHLERWLRRWGVAPGSALHVVVIEAPVSGREQRVRALRSLGGGVIMMAAHEDHICFATIDGSWSDRAAELFAARGWILRAGMAGPVDDVRLVADAHSRAQLAYGSIVALGRTGVADAADLGMLSALLDLSRRGELPASLTAPVDPLRDYDAAHGTSLVRTAFLFLESDGTIARVAHVLHVHRNTVRQRLERIARILGDGWDASPRRLETHLALHVVAARAANEVAAR